MREDASKQNLYPQSAEEKLVHSDSTVCVDPRFRNVVKALARHSARVHFAKSCFDGKKDSDLGD